MAFLIDATMKAYEVRGVSSGTSKKGNQFYSIRLESPDGRTCELSVTDSALFPAVEKLHKADICNFDVRAVSGRERSYISLLAEPVLVQSSSDGLGY